MYQPWHHKLGHPSHDVLKHVPKLCNVSIPNKQFDESCNAYCMGKVHRLPSTSSTTIYTNPLELIFCDLWGPSPIQSTFGYTYFLTFVYVHSRYTWIYTLKIKSCTLTTFVQFKALVELQFGLKTKSVQTDRSGEFKPLTHFLTLHGIIHRITCPHTHNQNGSVERKHRHVVEIGLILLDQANFLFMFWDHAFITTTYLINKLPSSTLGNNSPFFLLYSKSLIINF